MRRCLVAVIVALCLCAPATSRAGTYYLGACSDQVPSPSYWSYRGSPSMTVLPLCTPETSVGPLTGLTIYPSHRLFIDGMRTGQGLLGAWIARAPTGTRIVGVSGSAQLVVATAAGPIGDIAETDTGVSLRILPVSGEEWRYFDVGHQGLSSVWIRLRCPRSACTFAHLMERLQLRQLRLAIRDDTPPDVTPVRNIGAWHANGVVPVEFKASDNSGVADLRVAIDGAEIGRSSTPCYWPGPGTMVNCDAVNGLLRTSVDTSGLGSGTHTITARARDVGGLATERVYRFSVDRVPPGSPRRLTLSGGEQWRAENAFHVSWSNPPTGDTAPIAMAEYILCPASNGPYEVVGCVSQSRPIGPEPGSDTVMVPRDGAWTLRVGLRDAAGNFDPNQVATLEPLRLDSKPPTGTVLPIDAQDPTRVKVSGTDETSGVARADIELRRVGDDAWRPLAVGYDAATFSAIADDSVLPDGEYEIRARLFDRAGNERTVETDQRLRLPARSGGALAAGRPVRERVAGKPPRYRTKLVDSMTVAFGTAVSIEGTLADSVGNGRGGIALEVQQIDGVEGQWRSVQTVRTSASGVFSFQSPAGPSRRVRIRYAGSATELPLVKEVDIRVRAGITIQPDRSRVRNGRRVAFRGTLRGAPVPATGKLLSLQALTARGWRTFATPRARAKDGRWSSTYRFTGTSFRTRYAFRVVAPAESGYPYERGTSRTARVLVTP